jgi:hypothetical protein
LFHCLEYSLCFFIRLGRGRGKSRVIGRDKGTGRGRDGSTVESHSEAEAGVDSIKTEVNVEQRLWYG